MSLAFLSPGLAEPAGGFTPVVQSNIEAKLVADGAQIEERDGWRVAVGYGDPAAEAKALAETVGVAELSCLGVIELIAPPASVEQVVTQVAGLPVRLGEGSWGADAWWCPVRPDRVLAVTGPANTLALMKRMEEAAASAPGLCTVTDLTSAITAFCVAGPRARDNFARYCALDLRDREMPVAGFMPGSVGRVPGMLLRQSQDRYLHLFGAASAEYMWETVIDAAEELGGRPVGIDALGSVSGAPEATANA
ncbi:MAG: hypothetical protein ACKOK7_07655 [Solirubrobacterales bacterium]